MFAVYCRARNFINYAFKPQESDEDVAAAKPKSMIHEEDRNSVDEDDRKPPAKEVQKELRRSHRVPNSWRIGYNEESDSDEDVEGEGRERCLVSTSKADSERTLHLTDQTDDLDNNSGRQHERNKSWDAIYHQLVQFKVWLCGSMTDLHDVKLIIFLFCWAKKKEHGHCNVPFKTPKLGYWVATQRRDCKDSNRIEKLNRLGFSWNARDDSWIEMFEELKEFKVSSLLTIDWSDCFMVLIVPHN